MVCPEFLRGRGAPSLISDSSKSKQAREANRPCSGKGISKHARRAYIYARAAGPEQHAISGEIVGIIALWHSDGARELSSGWQWSGSQRADRKAAE
jgi:hypothetical protein